MDFPTAVLAVMGATTNESRRAAETTFEQMRVADPAAYCAFAIDATRTCGPDVAQFVAIAFKNTIETQGRAATEKMIRGASVEIHAALQPLVFSTEAQLPKVVFTPLAIGFGALLSLEYAFGTCPHLFQHLEEWVTSASSDVTSLAFIRSMFLVHQTLKAAAARPAHASQFEPVFERFAGVAWNALQVTAAVRGASEAAHTSCVLAAKVALRCASSIGFNAELIKNCIALCGEYCAFASTNTLSSCAQTQLCRIGKIVTAAVEKRGGDLQMLGMEFASTSLFYFLTSSLALPLRDDIPEKFMARALAALQTLLTLAESDDFISSCVASFFADSGTIEAFVRELVVRFLADADVTEDDWRDEPERCVIAVELDIDGDDAAHCAEQVFLAFLSAGKDAVIAPTWSILSGLLMSNTEAESIGALHAMGIAHATLAEGQGEAFRGFLHQRLLPVALGDVTASLKLRRRAIWMIGMWCFLVEDPEERKAIFAAFARIVSATNDAVICMTTWRSFENYVSDDAFSPEQVEGSVDTVLASIGAVAPRLRDPDVVKFVAQLLSVLIAKTEGNLVSCDSVVALLGPILGQLVQTTISEDDRGVAAAASELFTTCAQAAARCSDATAAWNHLFEVSIFATDSANVVNVMADVECWEVLFALTKCLRPEDVSGLASAASRLAQRCIESCDRDFEALPICVRCYAALTLVTSVSGRGDLVGSASAAVGVIRTVLQDTENDDIAAAAVCVSEAALTSSLDIAPELFQLSMTIAAKVRGERPQIFNAALTIAARCTLLVPAVWAAVLSELAWFVDAVAEGYDEMTDEYQRRLIVNSAVVAARFAASQGHPLDGDNLGLIAQTLESESLQEPWQSKEEQYAAMWGDDGTPSNLLARLHAIATSDSQWELLSL